MKIDLMDSFWLMNMEGLLQIRISEILNTLIRCNTGFDACISLQTNNMDLTHPEGNRTNFNDLVNAIQSFLIIKHKYEQDHPNNRISVKADEAGISITELEKNLAGKKSIMDSGSISFKPLNTFFERYTNFNPEDTPTEQLKMV